MASQRTGLLVQVGRAEVIRAVPGRAAAKAAPVTPRISIRRPFGIGLRVLESEWMGRHGRAGELRRDTITCWPTRRQNVAPWSRLRAGRWPAAAAGLPVLH